MCIPYLIRHKHEYHQAIVIFLSVLQSGSRPWGKYAAEDVSLCIKRTRVMQSSDMRSA